MANDIRVLLVNPGFRQVFGYTKEGSSVLPSLGLLSIASVLREMKGVEVHYFDCEVETDPISKELSNTRYDIVGITGVSPYFPGIISIAQEAKSVNKHTLVVVGGPHATVCYEDILRHDVFDAVVVGEGEQPMKDLAAAYQQGNSISAIGQTIEAVVVRGTRRTGSLVQPAYVNNLNTLPVPAYDLVDWGRYSPSVHRRGNRPFATVITSRGCPFRCQYCKTPFDPPYRFQNAKRVAQEVEHLVNIAQIQTLLFWDDTFTFHRKRAMEISRRIAKHGIEWSINTRPDVVDEELLICLREGGCKVIFYGVESSDERILRKLGREISPRMVRTAFDLTKKTGIKTVASSIFGTPFDTSESIVKSIDFIRSLASDYVFFSIYSANPGTFLHRYCQKELLLPRRLDWYKCNQYKGPPMGMPTVNPHLERKELQDLRVYAYSQFSSPSRIKGRVPSFAK